MTADHNGFLVATFSDADDLLAAVRPLHRERFPIYDVFAPYPIHGLDQAMGIRRTRLPLVTLLAGLCGLSVALFFQYYTNVFDWPLNVGGKPDNSTLAFVPVCFELTVLFGGLATVGALFLRTRLYPGKRESLPVERVTDDRFALVLRVPLDFADAERARQLLIENRAERIDERNAPP
ncbi:MAG: hypothetical protein QOI66_154 [Myxococcales bacterium]|jgi:hypothetical protein|nr:hypothetical protein [Myxococcales bacterium]